jgi:uncharacterized iron-regulated membrane protein
MSRANPGSFFRLVWRWHFWAGLLVTPVLFVACVTGGLFVFKDDLVDRNRAEWVFVTDPGGPPRPLDEFVEAVRGTHVDRTVGLITVPAGRTRATMIQFRDPGQPFRIAYVNPYTSRLLGDVPLGPSPFWSAVLTLHRTLFAGLFGRYLVELATAWAVVLVVSGVYLWIPKTWRGPGVWWLRFRAHRYTVLRDIHTVPGVYLAPVAVILCVTGLFFSPLWGTGYRAVTGPAGEYPLAFAATPDATPTPLDRSPVPIQAAVDAARARFPDHRLMIALPRKPADPYAVTVNGTYGPTVVGFVAVDRTTGDVVVERRYEELPALSKARLWVYPLHVGSVGGMTTKVIAAITCLVMAVACVTGVWMWLVRKRKGDGGLPRRPVDASVPLWGGALILILAVVLPAVGASLVLVLAGEWVYGKLTRTG